MHAVLLLTKIHSSRCAELARRVLRPRLLSSHKRFLTDGRLVGPPTLIRHRHRLRTCVHVSKIPMPCIWFSVSILYSRSYMRYAAFLSTYGPHHVGPSSPRTGNPCLYVCRFGFGLYSPSPPLVRFLSVFPSLARPFDLLRLFLFHSGTAFCSL